MTARESGGLFVWCPETGKGFDPAALALLGKARETADMLGARVHALWPTAGGKADPQALVASGADRVLRVSSPHVEPPRLGILARVAEAVVKERAPDALLFPDTPFLRALAARLAARLQTGCVAGAHAVELDTTENALVFAQRAFGGRVLNASVVTAKPVLALLAEHAYRVPVPDETRYGSTEDVVIEVREEHARVRPLERVAAAEPGRVPVAVGIGRGLGSEAAAKRARDLARLLGAKVVGDRHAGDLGWVEPGEVVGLGAGSLETRLYLALGVLGSMDHLAAVNAEVIAAVHAEPDAPVFRRANYGIVGEPVKVLDALLAAR